MNLTDPAGNEGVAVDGCAPNDSFSFLLDGGGDGGNKTLRVAATERAAVAAVNLVSLAALAAFSRLIYRQIEIGHPVYALLFQSVVVLTLLQLSAVLLLLVAAWTDAGLALWVSLEINLTTAALEFHEVNWACVTYLRYFFIVRADPNKPLNFDCLRKKHLLIVWIAYIFQLSVFYAARVAILRLTGWPGKRWVELSPLNRAFALLSYVTVALPDVYSIALYLKIRWHLKNRTAPEAASVGDGDGDGEGDGEGGRGCPDDNDLPFGGIYVGDNPSVQNMDSIDPGRSPAPDAVSSSVVSKQLETEEERKSREMGCVLTALRTYALVCLVDTALILELVWFLPKGWGKILVGNLCHQILSFWVPMAMVAMNFGPLRSVLLSALRLSRGSEESGVAY